MSILKDIKFFEQAGMDLDSAIEYRAKNDYGTAYNIRTSGTEQLGEGYIENIESNKFLSASLGAGINRCIGSAGFEDLRIGLGFIYNSQGNHRLVELNYDTQALTAIDISALSLNPQYYVDDIKIINETFLCFNDQFNPPGYINYQRLKSGGYGTLSANDFMLIQPQPPIPVSASFNNDASRSVNLLATKGWQFRTEFIGLDYEQSAYSTISQMFYPASESTPEVGTDVTKNNNLILSCDAGDNRVMELIVAATYGGLNNWFTIKTILYSDILLLPHAIDISNQIYEAYDPVTNLYYLVFYNDGLYPNIPVLQTDQLCDTVPLKAGAIEVFNGNQYGIGDIVIGYPRPDTDITLGVVNYNPNLTAAATGALPSLSQTIVNPGESGSGQGNHKRLVTIEYGGFVQENDFVTIVLVDIRDSSSTLTYKLNPCTTLQSGNTYLYITDESPIIPNSSTYHATDGNSVGLNIITPPYFSLQTAYITLFNAGAGFFKSIHALKTNSSYQLALAYYDYWGRPFPLQTDTGFVIKTNSYAQSHGQTPSINWQILAANAPANAYTYQWLISNNNTHQSTLFVDAAIINVIGGWNASANTPTLVGGTGTIGDAYEIEVPSAAQNLGNGVQNFNSGDFVVYNGTSWDIIPKTYGNLANTESYYFYLNALSAFNVKNNTSVLSYDFTVNDRCTLHYYQTPGVGNTQNWFDGVANPIVDVLVQGYNAGTFFLKVNKSSAINPATLSGKDILIEIYTPKQRVSTDATGIEVLNETVYWETGTAYPIVNGNHTVLAGTITQGDIYFKTREMVSSILPLTVQYTLLVEDFNFSDFYPSAFWSNGRPRSYSDTLETTEQVANIVYSEIFIIGSKVNGLTRFYPANVYGNNGGQTSSNFGRIQKMIQINNQLIILQELNHGEIPVYINIIEDQAEQQNVAISEKILGNIRYTSGKHIGLGNAKESVAVYNNVIYWIDPHRSEPIRWSDNGAIPISGKLSKYFKAVLQAAYAQGLKIIGWYDVFYDEYILSIQQPGGVVTSFAFNSASWRTLATYSVLPATITIISGPTHSSASYNNITGDVVLTPASGYVGSDTLQISFPTPDGTLTKNACFGWTAGNGTVNNFSFIPQINQPLSTIIQSNSISVTGNNVPVAISITGNPGFAYSINGAPFTASPGTVNPNDVVSVQVQSSASNNTLTSCTLTIGGTSATFNVTTFASGGSNVALSAHSQEDFTPTGNVKTTFTLASSLANDLTIDYSIYALDNGTTIYVGGIEVTLLAGNTTVIGQVFTLDSFANWTQITTYYVISPNPNGGSNIVFTSPVNDAAP